MSKMKFALPFLSFYLACFPVFSGGARTYESVLGQTKCSQFGRFFCPNHELIRIVGRVRSEIDCQIRCREEAGCRYYSLDNRAKICFFFRVCNTKRTCLNCDSGPKSPFVTGCQEKCKNIFADFKCSLPSYQTVKTRYAKSVLDCQKKCKSTNWCKYISFARRTESGAIATAHYGMCLLFPSCNIIQPNKGSIFGPRDGDFAACLHESKLRKYNLLIGGHRASRDLNSVELYPPVRQCKHPIPKFPIAIHSNTAVLLSDRFVITCAGYSNGKALNRCWRLDITRGAGARWEEAPSLKKARIYSTSVVVGDEMYVINGAARVWKGRTNTVERLSHYGWDIVSPELDLKEATHGHCSVAVGDRYIYRLGGQNEKGTVLRSVEVLDVKDTRGGSKFVSPMQESRLYLSCTIADVAGRKGILVVGGNHDKRTEFYSLREKTWTYLSAKTNDKKFASALFWNSGVLTIAGSDHPYRKTVEILRNGYWIKEKQSLSEPKFGMPAVQLPDEFVNARCY